MENKTAVENYSEKQRNEIVGEASEQYHTMVMDGKYKDLLVKFGENGKYSLTNLLYMLSQNPDMTVAKGMNEWAKLGREIEEGSKSMQILAPTKVKASAEVKDKDGKPKLDKDGNIIMREYEKTDGFHPMYVFDISQTKGEDYKPFVITKDISDDQKQLVLDGVFRALSAKNYKYKFTDASEFADNENYIIDTEKRTLKLRKQMGNQQTALSAIEGASKAICDNYKGKNFEGLTGDTADTLETSSRNCILAAHYGLDTKPFDFSVMNEFDETKREIFRDNLGVVCAGTKLVMDRVATAFYKAEQTRETVSAEEEIVDNPFRPESARKSEMEVA